MQVPFLLPASSAGAVSYYRTFLLFAQWQIEKVTAYSQIYVIFYALRSVFPAQPP